MSNRFLCFLAFFLATVAEPTGPTLNDDILGLIVFKADVYDPQDKLASWNEDDIDPCSWFGVKCDSNTHRVTELSLDGLGLSGKIGRGLLQLSSLRKLSLSRNNFSGTLNPDLTQLEYLNDVDLSYNVLSGSIPNNFFWQCRSLRSLSLAVNRFSGEIPHNVGDCLTLVSLNLSSNVISGSLPGVIWNLYRLRVLDLSHNLLIGELPKGMYQMLNLRTVCLKRNRLSGNLPDDIGGCLLLRSVDLGENQFSGVLPETMRKLTMCNNLNLKSNIFSGEVPVWLDDMKNLQSLDLSKNGFIGSIPDSIGSLQYLRVLNLSQNNLTSNLPLSIASLRSLVELDFSRNSFWGNLPSWLFQMTLQKILLSENNLSGPIIISSALEPTLQTLDLSVNMLSGEIPIELGGLRGLKILDLSYNSLISSIPAIFGNLKLLEVVDLSANKLTGNLPQEILAAASMKYIKLAKNSLTGGIPFQFGNYSSLTSLILSQNNLSGPIPQNLARLTYLQILDLSHNSFSGNFPKEISTLPHLIYLNLSHNFLSGEIPTTFSGKIPASSFSDNPDLCGAAISRSCGTVLPKPIVLNPNSSSPRPSNFAFSRDSLGHKKIIFSISALIAIGAAVFIAIGVITVTVLNLRIRSVNSHSAAALNLSDGYYSRSPASEANSGKLVMFGGDDSDFSTGAHAILNKDCELGRGGFGTVYKAILRDGRPVAIKKLIISSLVKSQEDFEREVRKIGKTKHPNLVILEGYYWTKSLQLLISEFVPNGCLFKQLHVSPELNCLLWIERFNIILGVARGLAHLHRHGIIHYNLKSCNVLIDSSNVPKIADFGLAKLLPMLDRYVLSSKIQSALGYMAPEFACPTVKITEKCDVYGFGVLLLEVITGRKPVEYMEDDVVVLCDVVRGALDEGRVEECLDGRLGDKFPMEEAMPIVKLGLICTSQVPSNRPDMCEVVKMLGVIRGPLDSLSG